MIFWSSMIKGDETPARWCLQDTINKLRIMAAEHMARWRREIVAPGAKQGETMSARKLAAAVTVGARPRLTA